MKSHPATDAYRMMTDEELASLAADIAENGLIDAIVTTDLDGEQVIVDGRNRFRACEIAGVTPRVEKLNGTDVRAFVAARGQRRNILKGQQAIALALLYPEAEKGGRGKKKERVDETSTFSAKRLQQARAILAHSRELAIAVRNGVEKFDIALKRVESERNLLRGSEGKIARLRENAPHVDTRGRRQPAKKTLKKQVEVLRKSAGGKTPPADPLADARGTPAPRSREDIGPTAPLRPSAYAPGIRNWRTKSSGSCWKTARYGKKSRS